MDPHAYVLGLIVLGLPAVSASVYLVSKPIVKLITHKREMSAGVRVDPARLNAQDLRIGQLEGDLVAMQEELGRLKDVEGFYKELRPQAPAGSALPPGHAPTT
jgi:hypothetical protein